MIIAGSLFSFTNIVISRLDRERERRERSSSPMECSPCTAALLPSSLFKKTLPTPIGSVNQLHRRHLHATSSSHHVRFQTQFQRSKPSSSDSSFTKPSAQAARFNTHRLTCAASVSGGGGGTAVPPSDAIILNVGGMMCEGCASSVKRILESQPQVSSATVDLAAQIAVIQPLSEATEGGVPNPNHLGETLAKHLTNCGFASNLRD